MEAANRPYRMKWRRHHDAVYWFDLKIAKGRELVFWQTISNATILNDSMPANYLIKMVKRQHHELLHHRTQPESPVTPKVILQPNRHKDQLHTGKLGGNPMTLVLRINVRYLEVHQAETDQEEDGEKWISNIERAILRHPDEDNFVEEMF